MNKLIKFLLLAFVPALAFGGATSSPPPWVFPGSTNVSMPFTLIARNIPVLTSGAPADIATFTLPPGVTRYTLNYGTSIATGCGRAITETAAGTLAAGMIQFYPAPTQSGGALLTAGGFALPAAAGGGIVTGLNPSALSIIMTSQVIYINQSVNSANAGTCSFFITIYPLN